MHLASGFRIGNFVVVVVVVVLFQKTVMQLIIIHCYKHNLRLGYSGAFTGYIHSGYSGAFVDKVW